MKTNHIKLGDTISVVATPIARALHLPCIDPETQQLRRESTCAKTRDLLNQGRYWDAFYERFFATRNNEHEKGGTQMIFLVQVAVEADDVREVVTKIPAELPIRSVMPGPPQPQQAQPARPAQAKSLAGK